MCSIYYMFYVNSSTIGDHLSRECRDEDLPHFTRCLLDHRTTELISQMKHADEVYSSKRRSRRGSDGFSAAADPLEALDPADDPLEAWDPADDPLEASDPAAVALRDVDGDKLGTDDGSGEMMPPADEITEGVVDDATARQMMMPYASVVFPLHSTTLRTFSKCHHNHLCCCRVA